MYIAKNVSQYIRDKIQMPREKEDAIEKAPQYNIFLHTQKPTHFSGTPITDTQAEQLASGLIAKWYSLKRCSPESLAITNALWYSLSDKFEFFPDNLAIETLEQLIFLGDYLWIESNKDDFNPSFVLTPYDGGGKFVNPHYRAFMYLRDTPTVCHPLISYEYKKHWSVLRYIELLDEVAITLSKWRLQTTNGWPSGSVLL